MKNTMTIYTAKEKIVTKFRNVKVEDFQDGSVGVSLLDSKGKELNSFLLYNVKSVTMNSTGLKILKDIDIILQ